MEGGAPEGRMKGSTPEGRIEGGAPEGRRAVRRRRGGWRVRAEDGGWQRSSGGTARALYIDARFDWEKGIGAWRAFWSFDVFPIVYLFILNSKNWM
jgi:hypothetical protein